MGRRTSLRHPCPWCSEGSVQQHCEGSKEEHLRTSQRLLVSDCDGVMGLSPYFPLQTRVSEWSVQGDCFPRPPVAVTAGGLVAAPSRRGESPSAASLQRRSSSDTQTLSAFLMFCLVYGFPVSDGWRTSKVWWSDSFSILGSVFSGRHGACDGSSQLVAGRFSCWSECFTKGKKLKTERWPSSPCVINHNLNLKYIRKHNNKFKRYHILKDNPKPVL